MVLLWLWCRPAPITPIRPLAWESPYAVGATLKKQTNKQTKKKQNKNGRKKGKEKQVLSNEILLS